jgi:hypothetical protein
VSEVVTGCVVTGQVTRFDPGSTGNVWFGDRVTVATGEAVAVATGVAAKVGDSVRVAVAAGVLVATGVGVAATVDVGADPPVTMIEGSRSAARVSLLSWSWL